MRLISVGDSGESVRDVQHRLGALGYDHAPDPPGEFGEGTDGAVRRFQTDRGLDPDGAVGIRTWQSLVESGFHLGDRVLYHRRPMLRGDDVAELQRRLNDLGFDADKVDGIFGPLTAAAVREFQHNRGIGEDGIAGPTVVTELVAVQRPSRRIGKETARELEWLRQLPTTVVGTRVLFDAGCATPTEDHRMWPVAHRASEVFQNMGGTGFVSRASDVVAEPRVRARRANRLGSDLVVSVQFPASDQEGVYYFDSGISRSPAGELLADTLAKTLGLESRGRALPMLRHTRAPAAVVASEAIGVGWADALVRGLMAFFERAAVEAAFDD
ncbi:MAG: peptidoglycan-binding protein [Acidimicrobiia bacterium]